MYCEPKTVTPKNTKYLFLTKDDLVRSTDLVRQTVYTFDSDYVFQSEVNKLNWQLVSDFIPVLAGKTVNEFEKHCNYSFHLEIIREVYE